MKLLIVFEKSRTGYAAYAPDLPGCIATGRTRGEVERAMREAVAFHLDGMREDGLPIPELTTEATVLDIPA
jgi:predicted RNase H-like HicB family nuclease